MLLLLVHCSPTFRHLLWARQGYPCQLLVLLMSDVACHKLPDFAAQVLALPGRHEGGGIPRCEQSKAILLARQEAFRVPLLI